MSKASKYVGWGLTAMLAILFIATGSMKAILNSTALQQASMLGINPEAFRLMGIVEVISILLFIVPRTGIVGTLLLIAYTGGIISAEVMQARPPISGVILQALVWLAAYFRFPELTQRLFRRFKQESSIGA